MNFFLQNYIYLVNSMSFNKTLEIFKIENPNWKIIKRIGDEGKDGLSYIIHHEISNVDGVVKLFKHKKD